MEKNVYIGNPLEAIREFCQRKDYRSIATMTEKECQIILGLALDNGEWKGDAINHIKILTSFSNFVEGNISFGKGDTYYFSIRYDGTVEVHKMEFDEKKMEFVHTKNRLQMYRFSDVTFFMMKCGFNLIEHLQSV